MGKLTKNRKLSEAKIDNTKLYNLDEACSLIKDITTTKFDASVDLAVRLGVDPKKANEMVRGVVSLPNGTGKDMKVLALVSPDKEDEAKNAGADYVGLDEYIEKNGLKLNQLVNIAVKKFITELNSIELHPVQTSDDQWDKAMKKAFKKNKKAMDELS